MTTFLNMRRLILGFRQEGHLTKLHSLRLALTSLLGTENIVYIYIYIYLLEAKFISVLEFKLHIFVVTLFLVFVSMAETS